MNVLIRPGKLLGTIDAMPSKSHAHRVLIAQKLAQLQGQKKEDALVIPAFSEDIEATKNCLVQLDKEMPFLDCKESGSTLRFLLPITMALKSEAVFIGSGQLPYRPISPLKEEMESHGCHFAMGNKHQKVSDKYKEICTVTGMLEPGEYNLAGNVSSQFITGLLFALPLLNGDSVIRLTTELQSAGYVDMTLAVLKDFGIRVDRSVSAQGFEVFKVPGKQIYAEPDDLTIEGDWSNACFWLVCGALGGSVTVRGLRLDSAQRDREIIDVLKAMGADVVVGDGITVAASDGLKGTEVSVSQIPDMVPVLAAAMSLADGTSMITDAERLKIKESDRLRTVYAFLNALGADISYGGSGLSFTGKTKLKGGEVDSYNDHRIAMAAAVASCSCKSAVTITNAEAVKKSYPDFFKDFAALGGKVREI